MAVRNGFIVISLAILAFLVWAGSIVTSRLDLIPGRALEIALTRDAQPVPPDRVTFVVIGDAGTGGRHQFRVALEMAQAYQREPFSLLLTTGDNVYFGDVVERVEEVVDTPYKPLFDAGVEFRPVLGNHDVEQQDDDADELSLALAALRMPARYYRFTQGPVDYFALDSNAMGDD